MSASARSALRLRELVSPAGSAVRPETFDVTRADGISPGRFDYTGMIEHEIGHALGFLSDRQRSVAVTKAQKGRIALDVEALAFASMRTVPPRLMGLEMHSDRVNGPALVLRAQIAQDGVQFDESLGPRGGFEIAFLVDSSADKERGDVDAIINARLLAAGPFDIESTLAGASWYVDGDPVFDKVRIIDPGAFGVAAPSAGGKDQDAPGSDDPR